MAASSTYLANAVLGHAMGRTAIFSLPSPYMALFRVSAGQSPRSTAVTAGQTTIPAAPNGRMYRCTTAGTTGSGEPTWPTGSAATVTDGTAVWTEMTPDFQGNVNLTEATYAGYARVPASGTGVWGAPNNGSIANTGATNTGILNFGQNTGASQTIAAAATYDSATSGGSNNLLMFEIASGSSGVLVASPNVAPFFGSGTFTGSLT